MNQADAGVTRLVVSIGNRHIRWATCTAGKLSEQQVLETAAVGQDERSLSLLANAVEGGGCRRVVISSVVPPALKAVREHLEKRCTASVGVVGNDIPLPMTLEVEHPEQVGVDRVCAAAAGYRQARRACIVADFGTAITINAVSDDGVFLGGAILPGVGLGALALAEHTAALPRVEVTEPGVTVGRNTVEAMQSGLFYGARGAVRELVEKAASEFGKWPYLIFAGGDALLIGRDCDFVDAVIPDLGLLGLELADHAYLESPA
jgi:type III pantothenate kinase